MANGKRWASRCAALPGAMLLGLSPSGPASAQAWIGEYVGRMIAQQAHHQCMLGVPMPAEEVEEARGPALQVMAGYWAKVATGQPTDVAPFFHPSAKSRWTAGVQEVLGKGALIVRDPLTMGVNSLAPEPVQFVRAGSGGRARGLWLVEGGTGQGASGYLADFTRRKGEWKLSALTLILSGEPVPQVTQFCTEPGDAEAYRARIAAFEQRRLEKRAAKLLVRKTSRR